ncbi:hypothetical protein A3D03_05005 [Candidatus Gottesmanbacteria bacterium RIFCSPHIGHO2_02_FULL_40_13]|uniref:Uncharacterized protein n=1 Tax=Candidatus Gottesmanbacteria bacterium RIFCSPHIGHO2_02_FULL_40_13 TaxID=1798384 RepID=A0A1F6ACT0_9BACT|nr:MAG: hypothetical protein A3D03_05005 [Candidatus Gottesmanbacteria bacterium RIFCSPHIGHO2_02_FULL_40_13]
MKRSPEQQRGEPEPQRLTFEKPKGWYRYGKIPYKIFYSLEHPTGSLVDDKNPGKFRVTPDTGGGYSLSIWVHEAVPAEYKDIVMHHELIEMELIFSGGRQEETHQQAVVKTESYAKTHLSPEEYENFTRWQKTLDNY